MAAVPHPLSALSLGETNKAREIVLAAHPGSVLDFRQNYLWEPPKAEVLKFLELEHTGRLTASSQRPARCAQVFYDVIGGAIKAQYYESIVDLGLGEIVDRKLISSSEHHASLTT